MRIFRKSSCSGWQCGEAEGGHRLGEWGPSWQPSVLWPGVPSVHAAVGRSGPKDRCFSWQARTDSPPVLGVHPSAWNISTSEAEVCIVWGAWGVTLSLLTTCLMRSPPQTPSPPSNAHTHFVHGQAEVHLGQSSAPCAITVFNDYLLLRQLFWMFRIMVFS